MIMVSKIRNIFGFLMVMQGYMVYNHIWLYNRICMVCNIFKN